MNIDELENTLNEKFIKVYQNILITGEWGIGKTYAIKEYFQNKKTIYISLFGINTIEDFKNNLYTSFIFKFEKIAKELINNIILRTNIPLGTEKANINSSISLRIFKDDINKVLKKQAENEKLIIIIDDLERKSSNLSMEVLLGVIEEFNTIDNIYTIIIANEKEIKKDNELYYSFKEKVIQKTINIDSYSQNAQKNLINNYLERILENKEIYYNYIEEILKRYKIKNLRIIEKAMKFIEFIINKINNKNLTEHEIKNILISSLLITIEKINLEIETKHTINNVDFLMSLEKKYSIEKDLIEEVLFIIADIYDDIDIESNLNKLIDYFHNVENTEEPLFCKSESNLREAIIKFKNNSIIKLNNKLNIYTWFRKLIEINEYAEIINYSIFKTNEDEKIKEVIEKYIEESNINISFNLEIERLYKLKKDKIDKNDILKLIYNIIIDEIKEKIIDDSLYKISEELNKNNYDLNHILEVFNNAYIMNIENNLIKKLKKYDYFFPDLNNNINENSWGIAHTICKKVTECSERKNNDFEIFINKIFDEANKIGKYRIGILMQKYNIKLENN